MVEHGAAMNADGQTPPPQEPPSSGTALRPKAAGGGVWRKRLLRGRDWVWPKIDPFTAQELEREKRKKEKRAAEETEAVAALAGRPEPELENAFEKSSELLDSERDRKTSIETRLAGVFAFSSVVIALSFNIFSNVVKDRVPGWWTYAALAAWIYVVLQLVCAAWAAVQGLWRRGYSQPKPVETIPKQGEERAPFLLRQIGSTLWYLRDHEQVNNEKLTHMTVAHTAIRNFLVGVVLAVSLTLIALTTATGSDEQIVAKLRSNPKLIELLKGPKGDPGLAGPQGDPGRPGTAGPRGEVGPTGTCVCGAPP
jgi:heme/copper-type cytochrome/quinol oxidase subunit 4